MCTEASKHLTSSSKNNMFIQITNCKQPEESNPTGKNAKATHLVSKQQVNSSVFADKSDDDDLNYVQYASIDGNRKTTNFGSKQVNFKVPCNQNDLSKREVLVLPKNSAGTNCKSKTPMAIEMLHGDQQISSSQKNQRGCMSNNHQVNTQTSEYQQKYPQIYNNKKFGNHANHVYINCRDKR